ncbi:hypothetical protein [Tardiphaga sp.]|uniref:hypothetical protein n=1 Tax=Tardiphaga sp. TaxID=1926292 RepID=UPI0026276B44|nr:hypothetical protein [Tardiphaga sp.]MDB5618541.1 hypothetical protein [Tardiphaga sp.]
MPHPGEIRLEKLAAGKCNAVSRPAALGVGIRWWPKVGPEIVVADVPEDGFATKPEAVAAARIAKEFANDIRAQANGEAP